MPYRNLTEVLKARTPPWLHGVWGKRWTTALGAQFDLLTAWAKDGVKARMVGLCPTDALEYHGSARGIEQASGESDADYRARLLGAWGTWLYSGTDYGIYNAFEVIGWTIEPLNADGTVPTLPGSSHVWIRAAGDWLTADPTDWARFWVILDLFAHDPALCVVPVFGAPLVWGGGWVFGVGITTDHIDLWAKTIRKWKGAHATCVNVSLITVAGGFPGGPYVEIPIGEV